MAKTCLFEKWYSLQKYAGGSIKTFTTGTSTPTNHYTDASGSGATNTTTIPSNGRVSVWLSENVAHRLQILDSLGNIKYDVDNVYGLMNVDTSTIQSNSTPLSAFASQVANTLCGTTSAGVITGFAQSSTIKAKTDHVYVDGVATQILLPVTSTGNVSSYTLDKSYFSGDYDIYRLNLDKISVANNGLCPTITLSSDNGSTFDSSYTIYSSVSVGTTSPYLYSSFNTTQASIPTSYAVTGYIHTISFSEPVHEILIYNMHSTTKPTMMIIKGYHGTNGGNLRGFTYNHVVVNNTGAHNCLKLSATANPTTFSGNIALTGIGKL